MSLSKSPVPPAEAATVLKDAFVEVCENSFFAYVEPCNLQRFSELATQVGATVTGREDPDGRGTPKPSVRRASEWLKAAVGFSGSFVGAIEIILPEGLARSLVSSLLGEASDAELPEHQVFDGIGEFANMICGAWLTNLSDRQAFQLRAPVVTRMAPGWTPITDAGWNDERWHRLAVNDQPVRVRFRPAADRA